MYPIRRLRRFLRSPWTISAELLSVVAAGVVLTAVPQASDPEASALFLARHPWLAALVRAASLDRVLHSAWFLALALLFAASLVNVLFEQVQRWRREWNEVLTAASFRSAPYRRELDRPARSGPHAQFLTRGRWGLAGTPLFHLGLALVMVAAAARGLLSSEAIVELVEGEEISFEAPAFADRGPLSRPFRLDVPVRFEKLSPARYTSGNLRGLSAELRVGEAPVSIAINEPLDLGAEQLYLAASHGPAALLVTRGAGEVHRSLVLLRESEGTYQAALGTPGGEQVLLRTFRGEAGALPAEVEVRVLRDTALLFAGSLAAGQAVKLVSGEEIELHALRYWATFQGARDPSRWVAFAGFLAAGLGALLMFAVVKVDTAVVVTPTERGERVLVALRAQRFAPLFAERFEELVREQLGPGGA